jgi:hypothetical protein
MKKNWVEILVIVAILALIGSVIWWQNLPDFFGPGTKVVEFTPDTSDWVAYKYIAPNDTTHVYKVTWSQSWGTSKIAYCKVVFKNDKQRQYRLVAPWLSSMDIERNNMDDIKCDLILFDSTVKAIINQK